MSESIQAIRGMNDILPEEMAVWHYVENILQTVVTHYGYQEIRFPLLEQTALFKRAIGEATDVVEKEMYTFLDREKDSLTLRPEGTASCVRAGIEHSLFYHQQQKLWYYGPMFRHERPQKGRYRQFYQLGVEAFGMIGPDIDAEIISMRERLWRSLGFTKAEVVLNLNCLGTREERQQYRQILIDYFSQYKEQLDEDCQRRLITNPLRILDSKNPALQKLIESAPHLIDVLGDESKRHFDGVCELLTSAGIAYVINPRLVRGLDYYSLTVFEWVTTRLGAQGSIGGGGRFDYLVEQMGGDVVPAIGFALGIERIIALVKEAGRLPAFEPPLHGYLVLLGEEATRKGFALAEGWRDALPLLKLQMNCGEGALKSQLKKADKSGASLAFILGEEELKQEKVMVKYLREDRPQELIDLKALPQKLQQVFQWS